MEKVADFRVNVGLYQGAALCPFLHTFIHCKPRGLYGTIVVQEIITKTQVHDSDATLARHIARFDAMTESDTSVMSARRNILSAGMRSTCPR